MGNPNLLPYETIVRATSGEPEAVDEVLRHYSKRIRIAAIENGHIDRDTEDSIKQQLVAAPIFGIFKNRQYYAMQRGIERNSLSRLANMQAVRGGRARRNFHKFPPIPACVVL